LSIRSIRAQIFLPAQRIGSVCSQIRLEKDAYSCRPRRRSSRRLSGVALHLGKHSTP